jgi:hypothetical protein
MPESTLDADKDVCPCLTDWQKTFDHTHCSKFMLALKNVGIDWSERILIRK